MTWTKKLEQFALSCKLRQSDERLLRWLLRRAKHGRVSEIEMDLRVFNKFIERDRVIDSDLKVTGTSKGLRHLWSYINTVAFRVGSFPPESRPTGPVRRELMAKIPYAPGDPLLIAHVDEILAQPQVECGDYRGETFLTGGSTNSIQQ